MRRLLWIGDAGCQSGFARVTHGVLDVVRKGWDVSVLGLNYLGDPHGYPYPIYPCFSGGDAFGIGRLPYVLKTVQPDAIVIQNDPWNFRPYLKIVAKHVDETPSLRHGIPVVGMVAVDGLNCRGAELNGLALAAFWTQYGLDQARLGGFAGTGAVVPLGVDLDIYHPQGRREARRALGLPESVAGAFIVGNVNRNQQRKRLDLTIEYFADWVRSCGVRDAFLFLHVAPTGDMNGYDCDQMARYYGVHDRLILCAPPVRVGASEARMAQTYAAFDVQMSTTQGEGWGLCTMEGMACGVPQIVPDWSALGEWPEDAVVNVPCPTTAATPGMINVIGGVADRQEFVAAFDRFYREPLLRRSYGERGLALVRRPEYRWPAVGERFGAALEEALAELPEPEVASV